MFLSKLFKRNAEAKGHLRDNRGDENVTKMIWVVIVFVVGALLLTIVSGAFSGKVADWYDGTMDSWFNESNGMYATEGGNAGGAGAGNVTEPQIGDIRTFTITLTAEDGTEVTAEATYEYGMTWGEWVESEYNAVIHPTEDWQISFVSDGEYIYIDGYFQYINGGGEASSLIDENATYQVFCHP